MFHASQPDRANRILELVNKLLMVKPDNAILMKHFSAHPNSMIINLFVINGIKEN